MKKIIALLLAAVMVMCLFAGCASSGGSKVIKIGVFEPQSGDNGAGGKQEVLGIQYANSVKPTVTINGEEYKIELDIQDNQSSTDKAVSAAQQLVADKVSVVLGSYGSGVSIAAGTYFANAKIPAIGCSCTTRLSPPATIIISASASSIRSRAPSWPRSPWKSSAPRRPTSCRCSATTTPSAWPRTL